jgi:hypothetical protein
MSFGNLSKNANEMLRVFGRVVEFRLWVNFQMPNVLQRTLIRIAHILFPGRWLITRNSNKYLMMSETDVISVHRARHLFKRNFGRDKRRA